MLISIVGASMEFKDKKAIYLQMADHMCESILQKQWHAHEKIPSIRDTAATLEVNPNTVTRTYSYLEALGVIQIQRGVGYFVTENAMQIIVDLKKKRFFSEELPRLFHTMKLMNIDIDDIVNIYHRQGIVK
jgi:GntR family transcriptional regulator